MLPQEFLDDGDGNVKGVKTVQVEWTKDETGRWKMDEVEGTEKVRKMQNMHFKKKNSCLTNL